MYLSEINIYPIKSCGGISLDSHYIDEFGFSFDRRFMVIDGEGNMVTQRAYPSMALIKCSIENDILKINFDNKQQTEVPLKPIFGEMAKATVWSQTVRAIEPDKKVSEAFSSFLGFEVKLVYMPDNVKRLVDFRYNDSKAITSFTDGFPFLLIGENSLNDLNHRLKIPVPMNRFRPNLVVAQSEAFAEDRWNEIKIGNIAFGVKKPCARCVMTTINQDNAQKSPEPLKTLASYRTKNSKVYFGQNLIHIQKIGQLYVGDRIEIIS